MLVRGRDRGKAKYRDKCQIYYLIIKNCIGKYQTKNRLSYYGSYKRLNEHLSDLLKLELLSYDDNLQKFIATPKGNEYVRKYDNILDFVPCLKSEYDI